MCPSLPSAARTGELSPEVVGGLLGALPAVPDPRPSGWRRHPTAYVLGVLVMSFACAGFGSLGGVAQWAAAADRDLLLRLGNGTRPADRRGPAAERGHAATDGLPGRPRRVGGGARGLDRRSAGQRRGGQRRGGRGRARCRAVLAVAVDGKTVRGASIYGIV